MKNFYKLLNGKKVTSGNGAINIASSPLDSSGTIVFIDGTKLDFLGGLSIESSRSEYIGRSNENSIFSVKDPSYINAKYFPIIGFGSGDNTTNIGNTIFNFENLSNIELNDDNYNQEKKIFSHTTKFRSLQLKNTLQTSGNSVLNDVTINANTNANNIADLGGKITVLEGDILLGTDPNINSTYQYIFNVIKTDKKTGNLSVNSDFITSKKFISDKLLTVSNSGAAITGNSIITGELEISDKVTGGNGLDVTSGGATITGNSTFINKLTTDTIYGKDAVDITKDAYFRKKDESKFILRNNSNFKTGNAQNNPNALDITGYSYFENTTVTKSLSTNNNGSLKTKKLIISGIIPSTTPIWTLNVTGLTNKLSTLTVDDISTTNNPITMNNQNSTISLNDVDISNEFSNKNNNSIYVGTSEKTAEIILNKLTANSISDFKEGDVTLSSNVNLKLTGSNSEIATTIKGDAYLNSDVILDTDNNDDINTTLTINNSLSAKAIDFGPKGSAVINGDTAIDDLIKTNKLIVESGGVVISGDSTITGTLSDNSTTGNNLTVSANTSSQRLEITSTSVFTGDIIIGDKTKQNTGELEVSGNAILGAALDVTKDTVISGATITENNKLTATGGLEVLSGDTTFKDPLEANTLEVSETTESKKFKVTSGGIFITGDSTSGSLSSPDYDAEVSAHSSVESILDISSKYPSLLAGSLGSNAIKTNLDTKTLEVTGTSTFSDNISITGNLTADSITLTNAEINATNPEIDSSWLESIPTTAITPASVPSVSVGAITPTTYTTKNTANPTTYSKGSKSEATVSSTITVENNIKFTEMTVNTTFNPTTLDETYAGTTGGSVTTDRSVTTSTLKLSEWTDDTNFIPDKTSYDFKDIKDSNASNLAWSASDGYQLYAKVLDETSNSNIEKYILFAYKGDDGYEFIEDDTTGCRVDMSTTTTKIYLGGEFIESEGGSNNTADPAMYITTFVPEITYSTSTGFTVTNFSTLLADTGTTTSDWEVGLLKYHKAHLRYSGGSFRHFRTSWNYVYNGDGEGRNAGIFNIELRVNSSGVVSNTKEMYKYKVDWNDTNYGGQTTGFLGIRLRYKGNKDKRSMYSRTMISTNGTTNFSTVITANYIK